MQLWLDRRYPEVTIAILEEWDSIAISGCSIDGQVLKLQLVGSLETDRDADDFIRGICVPSGRPVESGNSKVMEMPEPARSDLIIWLAARAKPFKPYIPKRMIPYMYKLLQVFR